ncbi:hypothetical protein IMZ48_47355 [Candidatus Bathyarchaeota archaeon]|nr:hypothetical protein [Candidatus Bathyarchaeota archaeon]
MFSRALRARAVPAIRAARAQPIVAARTVTTNAAGSSLENPIPKVSLTHPGLPRTLLATVGQTAQQLGILGI